MIIECLERKFSTVKYEDKYSAKCLYKDLIDFQELTKENIKKLKTRQEELIKLIQESKMDQVDEKMEKLDKAVNTTTAKRQAE